MKKYIIILASFVIIVITSSFSVIGGVTCSYYDLYQNTNFSKLFSIWSSAWYVSDFGMTSSIYSGTPFFSLIAFLTNFFHLTTSQQTFLYYFLFLSAAYICFYLALKLFDVNKKLSTLQKTSFSLMYTFSFYSVYAFYYQCHFTPFLYLFPLVPLIFALIYRYIRSDKNQGKLLALTIITLAFTNIINFNIPYFFSLNIFIAGFFLIYYILMKIKSRRADLQNTNAPQFSTKKFLFKLFKFYVLYALIIMWSVLPQAIEMLGRYNAFQAGGEIFDLRAWISWQAMKFPEPFLMFWDAGKYIQRIPLTVYSTLTFTFLATSFLIIYKKRYKIELVLFSLYLLFIFLANKGVGWLPEFITWAIFKNPLLAALRSYDKTLIFLPGILFLIIVIFYIRNKTVRPVLNRIMIIILAVVSIVASYPLWSGQMQTKYSMINDPGKTYETSEYTGIHIIPDDYNKVADIINADKTDFRILRVPYAVVESPGWVNFPKWKMQGADPTVQLFDASTIQMNAYGGSFGTWNFGQQWNDDSEKESSWLMQFVAITNTKYIIYHNDVQPQFIDETKAKMAYYEQQDWITKIFDGEYITAYKVADRFFTQHFYIPDRVQFADGDQTKLPDYFNSGKYLVGDAVILNENNLDNTVGAGLYQNLGQKPSQESISWTQKDPTKYTIDLTNVQGKVPVVFSESYHSQWNLYVGDKYDWFTKDIADETHVKVNGYANAWLVNVNEVCGLDGANQTVCVKNADGTWNVKLTLEFTPQRTYDVSLVVTLVTLAGVVGYLVIPSLVTGLIKVKKIVLK